MPVTPKMILSTQAYQNQFQVHFSHSSPLCITSYCSGKGLRGRCGWGWLLCTRDLLIYLRGSVSKFLSQLIDIEMGLSGGYDVSSVGGKEIPRVLS